MQHKWMFVDGDYLIAYLYFRGPEVVQNFWMEVANLAAKFKVDRVAIAWDDRKGKRRVLYPEYKKGRNDLYEWQLKKPEIKGEILESGPHFPVVMGRMPDLEADDLVWIWTRKRDGVIVSGDFDLWQCLREGVEIWMPRQKRLADTADVYFEYGGDSLAMVLQRCMTGDRSDNIKGVEGVGEKRARDLWSKCSEQLIMLTLQNMDCPNPDQDKWLQKVLEQKEVMRRNFKLMKFAELIEDAEMHLGEMLLEKPVKFDIESARKHCAWKGWHLIFQRWQPLKEVFQHLSK